jgi:ribokinase
MFDRAARSKLRGVNGRAQGGGPQRAGRLAAAAAGATAGHPGGRPALTPKAVQDQLTLLAEGLAESSR